MVFLLWLSNWLTREIESRADVDHAFTISKTWENHEKRRFAKAKNAVCSKQN